MKKRVLLVSVLFAISQFGLAGFDRGLGNPNSVFIPKGQFSTGISASYNGYTAAGDEITKGLNIAGIVTDASGEVRLFSTDVHGSWFFMDNTSIGVRASYGNTMMDCNSLSLLGMLDLSNKHLRKETYSAYLTFKRYIPILNSRILAFFGEAALGGSMGYSKSYEETDRGNEGTFSELYSAGFIFSGGVSLFVTDFLSVEMTVPYLSIGMDWDKRLEKQEYKSSFTGLTFKDDFNLLGFKVGLVFHF